MRVTVTLEPDVYEMLTEAALRQRTSFKAVLNDAVRRGLTAQYAAPLAPFVVRPHRIGLLPGVAFSKTSQLLNDLEAEEFVADTQ